MEYGKWKILKSYARLNNGMPRRPNSDPVIIRGTKAQVMPGVRRSLTNDVAMEHSRYWR